jgi:hypothetical protein
VIYSGCDNRATVGLLNGKTNGGLSLWGQGCKCLLYTRRSDFVLHSVQNGAKSRTRVWRGEVIPFSNTGQDLTHDTGQLRSFRNNIDHSVLYELTQASVANLKERKVKTVRNKVASFRIPQQFTSTYLGLVLVFLQREMAQKRINESVLVQKLQVFKWPEQSQGCQG